MSYENTACPCGGKKLRETLICDDCADHIAASTNASALRHWRDEAFSPETRRSMAIRILSLSRRRNRSAKLPLHFAA